MLNNRRFATRFFTFTNLLVWSFLILGFIGIINHELWQDEMQAWTIARDSSSIADLLKNLKYEGHPALWYLCLRFLNWFTHNPFIMQVFHLVLATISICIFVIFSPFTKLQKVLFTFGYFPFYEYNILSRNYNLGVLLIFSFCALFFTRRTSYFPLAIILALLAHTNVFGLILAIVLQLTLLLEIFTNINLNANLTIKRWDFIASLLIVVISIVGAIIQLRPPSSGVQGNLIAPDTTVWQTIFAQVSDINRLMELISNIWKAYFPIYQFSWLEDITLISLAIIFCAIILKTLIKRSVTRFLCLAISALFIFFLALDKPSFLILEAVNTPDLLGSLVSLAILFFLGSWFVRQPVILCLYISGTLGIFLFTYFIYFSDNLRHTGHFFLIFLVCLWLQEDREIHSRLVLPITPKALSKGYKNKIISLIFSIHLITGTIAYTKDLVRPFSMSKATSSYLKNTELDELPIMGIPDERVSALSGYLDRKIYYPQSDRWGSFIIWDSQRKHITATDIVESDGDIPLVKRNILKQVNKIVQKKPTDIILVSTAPINFKIPSLKITPIKQFVANTIGREKSYRLYLIQKETAE